MVQTCIKLKSDQNTTDGLGNSEAKSAAWLSSAPREMPTWPKTLAAVMAAMLTASNIQSFSASRKIDPELSAELGSEPLLEKRLLTCKAKGSYKHLHRLLIKLDVNRCLLFKTPTTVFSLPSSLRGCLPVDM